MKRIGKSMLLQDQDTITRISLLSKRRKYRIDFNSSDQLRLGLISVSGSSSLILLLGYTTSTHLTSVSSLFQMEELRLLLLQVIEDLGSMCKILKE